MADFIDISQLDKAAVLAALYDHAKTQGLGTLRYRVETLPPEEARRLLEHQTYFDYLRGRVMKVELGKDQLDPRLYDRDNGPGAARAALAKLLEDQDG